MRQESTVNQRLCREGGPRLNIKPGEVVSGQDWLNTSAQQRRAEVRSGPSKDDGRDRRWYRLGIEGSGVDQRERDGQDGTWLCYRRTAKAESRAVLERHGRGKISSRFCTSDWLAVLLFMVSQSSNEIDIERVDDVDDCVDVQ